MDAADEAKLQAWDRLAHALEVNGQRPLLDGLLYPGNGRPPRMVDTNPETPGWPRLAKDSNLGQKGVILYDADEDLDQIEPCSLCELNGTDLDACQVQVTLGAPMAIPKVFAELAGERVQNLSGEFNNSAMSAGFPAYPGTGGPIVWPPLLYVIEWGIGGARQTMVCDAVNGARINLTCSFLRVYGAVSPDAQNQPGTSGAYVLSAFVGPGWPTPSARAQRTIYVGDLAPGTAESDIYPVPLHAIRGTAIGAGTVQTAAVLKFFQDPAGVICVGSFVIAGNQPIAFPIPNAGQYFSVTSSLEVTVSFAAFFELAA